MACLDTEHPKTISGSKPMCGYQSMNGKQGFAVTCSPRPSQPESKNPGAAHLTDAVRAFSTTEAEHRISGGTYLMVAVGLNPDTAAYTKSKPRVPAYMIEHRNTVREKLVDQEAEGLRKLNLGRDQILTRLWELANLSHEVTRGIIPGQIKALSMIVAIEGLIPDRRPSPVRNATRGPARQGRNLHL
jgi:hypothetical protein